MGNWVQHVLEHGWIQDLLKWGVAHSPSDHGEAVRYGWSWWEILGSQGGNRHTKEVGGGGGRGGSTAAPGLLQLRVWRVAIWDARLTWGQRWQHRFLLPEQPVHDQQGHPRGAGERQGADAKRRNRPVTTSVPSELSSPLTHSPDTRKYLTCISPHFSWVNVMGLAGGERCLRIRVLYFCILSTMLVLEKWSPHNPAIKGTLEVFTKQKYMWVCKSAFMENQWHQVLVYTSALEVQQLGTSPGLKREILLLYFLCTPSTLATWKTFCCSVCFSVGLESLNNLTMQGQWILSLLSINKHLYNFYSSLPITFKYILFANNFNIQWCIFPLSFIHYLTLFKQKCMWITLSLFC